MTARLNEFVKQMRKNLSDKKIADGIKASSLDMPAWLRWSEDDTFIKAWDHDDDSYASFIRKDEEYDSNDNDPYYGGYYKFFYEALDAAKRVLREQAPATSPEDFDAIALEIADIAIKRKEPAERAYIIHRNL